MNNLIVYCEIENGIVADVSLELLTKGRSLANKLGCQLEALVIGSELSGVEKQIFPYGADRIYLADDKRLAPYTSLPHTSILIGLFKEIKPQICLMGATCIGRDLGPRVSSALHSGLTADCTKLEISEEKELWSTRPAFGGNLMATIVCPDHRPQMSTVRPGVMKAMEADANRKGEVIDYKINFDREKFRVKVLETVKSTDNMVDISEAKILVSGGRGVGTKEGFEMLGELAKVLKGEVSSSRACVDAGIIGHERQVGQTGKTVRPDLYLACGISGAIQHLAGMEESELIIAINKDKFAPIMSVADLGIVGDAKKIIPILTEKLKAIVK